MRDIQKSDTFQQNVPTRLAPIAATYGKKKELQGGAYLDDS